MAKFAGAGLRSVMAVRPAAHPSLQRRTRLGVVNRVCPAGAIGVGMRGAGNTTNEYSRSVVNRYIRGFVVARHRKSHRVRAALVTEDARLRPSGRGGGQRGARAVAQCRRNGISTGKAERISSLTAARIVLVCQARDTALRRARAWWARSMLNFAAYRLNHIDYAKRNHSVQQ